MKIKILWYNVLRGFHNKKKDGTFEFESKRLKAVKKVVKSISPDIIFFGEGDFNPRCKIKGSKIKIINYKKEFAYPHAYYSKPDKTSRKGEVILSRFPILVKNISKGDYSNENYTYIKTWTNVKGKKINIDMIHPYPTIKEKMKAKFVGKVLNKKEKNYILLGDFNALSPQDEYKISELTYCFNLFRNNLEESKKNAKESVKGLMLKKIISNNLVDVIKSVHANQINTYPTKKYSPFKNKKSVMRIDYIFCSKNFKVINAEIIKNKLTDMASDHYPIYAEMELN